MRICICRSLLIGEYTPLHNLAYFGQDEGASANHTYRQHPAVLTQPQKVFAAVVLALEAKTLQGQIAVKVVTSTKNLLQITGQDLNVLTSQLGPEAQLIARSAFS